MKFKKIILFLFLTTILQAQKYNLSALQKACNVDNKQMSCFLLGGVYFKGKQVAMDLVKSKIYFTKSCKLGNKTSCKLINSIDKIFLEMQTKYKKECNENKVSSCISLATQYLQGKLLPKSYKSSLKYFKKACELKDLRSCLTIPKFYLRGIGVEIDVNKAAKYIIKSCYLGSIPACKMIANKYETGNRVKQDKKLAKKLYKKACSLGDKKACIKYKSL